MKITNIIGFIIILLADLASFFMSMNMPAGSKVAGSFLIFNLITLGMIIVHLVGGIKENRLLVRISSALLIVVSGISLVTSGRNYSTDLAEYGQYFNIDGAFKAYIILILLNVIFGIIGLILSLTKSKQNQIAI